nr:hypothetical protein BaRGS_034889 [Batillaria attramentaria]
MQDKVAKYIQYDASDHANDKDHCDVIVQRVTSEFGDVDGCITLWDLYVPLTALVCARLGKPGIPHAGAFAAMSKTLTMNTLASVSGEKGRGSLSKYTSSCYPVKSISDLENLHGQLNFPAILKVDFGAGSVATKLANSVQEGIDHFRNIQNLQKHSERSYYLGGSFSSTCMLAEYLEGSEHCVDLAIFHGELVCAFVSDKGPQIPPDVFKTVITMPSLLPEDKLESVITAAYECCMGLKLEHGVFDVDVMLTKSGPKLIEINPRVGGYCQREFILQCYKVDLAHLAFMVACDDLHDKGEILFLRHERELLEQPHEISFCTVAVKDESFSVARSKLIQVCRSVCVSTDTAV